MIGAAAGCATTTTAASSARLVFASVTTASRPNIWRTSASVRRPSASVMTRASRQMVTTPPSCVATNAPNHSVGPNSGAGPAIACRTASPSPAATANWATLKTSLIGGRRDIAIAAVVPTTTPTMKSGPDAKISASVTGMSVSEKACALRLNCRLTGQRSQAAIATAMTHQGARGSWMATAPSTGPRKIAAAIAIRVPFSHQTGWTLAKRRSTRRCGAGAGIGRSTAMAP